MNIEKIREEFQAAFLKRFGFGRITAACNPDAQQMLEAAEWAWQASRQSLVIELPSLREVIYGRRDNENDSGFNSAIDLCAKAIESAGVKCEVKS